MDIKSYRLQLSNLESSLIKLGKQFVGRLDESVLTDDMSYVGYAEYGLALECLAEHLYEYEVAITRQELDMIYNLASIMEQGRDAYAFLESLVR